ncbi:hypothetical protein [Gimesia algae]|uniref:Uncharacterized protein n=1 Tax=Gimesia algae TaxID=2527971 RepID=A0A517VGB0_9PLAN|nr:hypothetical protein [Gimesia algae]QDT92015.1 hypothetical protein Pan161_36790 [Gimesia algae]
MSTITIDAPESRSNYPSTLTIETYTQTVIRMLTWVLGSIVFCLAMVDFYAQTYAHETELALLQAQTEMLEQNNDLRMSDVNQYIAGTPSVLTRPADNHTQMCKKMKEYTWKGFFRDYTILVYVGLGENPSIDFVHGPGEMIKDLPAHTLGKTL